MMETKKTDAEKKSEVAYGITVIGLAPFRLWSHGFVLSKLYGWFVRSLWDRLPEIGVAHWIGISLFLGVLTLRYRKRKQSNEERFEDTVMVLGVLWIGGLIGWILS